jgi:hypothetical protein
VVAVVGFLTVESLELAVQAGVLPVRLILLLAARTLAVAQVERLVLVRLVVRAL